MTATIVPDALERELKIAKKTLRGQGKRIVELERMLNERDGRITHLERGYLEVVRAALQYEKEIETICQK